ncbi:sulfatase-like hydrolase/transferase [Gordonia pseudamarae]|uniref:Sulfatase-like hydrolase/transferase n=1 Tax=Gordonia pseudamarae TaxID=2831662 RepID=A0ABX6IGZ3_9ACTN|nr:MULTISPECIES: sulfatase [Gordonia]MBD0020533.1 sulfatase [Gordonia sp. (in: high G+C Gram-positive bacteria)]QHN25632.1 sulfatase-like hydrolase/transferase [Gordonia pseudamarae]QHN34565.1 sulfatase-like hydrolase/transferase [Gordonia pseudamarae]
MADDTRVTGERSGANVIFVHWHDLGRHLACYGAVGVQSPVLDQLAADGVLLTSAHATAPLCSPARGSLFTGQYPHRNGLVGLAHHGFAYRPGVRTLPSLLSEHGYRTVLFGMQHESTDPSSLGFGTIDVSDSRCDYVVERATEWIDDDGVGDQPFFLTAGFFETHRPYPEDEYPPADPDAIGVPDFLPDTADVRADLAGLHGSIAKADAAVGRLLDAIERAGLADNTWIVFATDHGLAFPRAKSTLYAEGTGISFIIRPPRVLAHRGSVYDGLFSGVDLTPTLLDLLGLPIPADLDGLSHARELLADSTPAPPQPASPAGDGPVRTAVFTEKTYHDAFDPIRAIRTRDFSYIENLAPRPQLLLPLDIADSLSARSLDPQSTIVPRAQRELYDLRFDPHERNNLAGNPTYADIEAELAGRLAQWRSRTGDTLPGTAVGTEIAAEFMRAWMARSADKEPGEEALPSRRPLGSRRELAGEITTERVSSARRDMDSARTP